MAIEVFNRYEHKYLLNTETLKKVIDVMDKYMILDFHCENHLPYTIANIYYDTVDSAVIRESLSKPIYKEKLRLRSYGVPTYNSEVFLEIKKKYNGIVNKRRTILHLDEAYEFIKTGVKPEMREYINKQVINEIEYYIHTHTIVPKVYIAYDRIAYFGQGNNDLRISFDCNIRTRRNDVALELGDYGSLLLQEDEWLMEVKTSFAKPLWLCSLLSELGIRDVSFSKYGMEYKKMLRDKFLNIS